MADTPLGWYKWYPRDFATSVTVRSMSFTARAIYRELLDIQWENGCLTPVERLLNIMGTSVEQWSEFAPYLDELFPNGRNPKLDELRNQAIYESEIKSKAGKASAESRAAAGSNSNGSSTGVEQVLNTRSTKQKQKQKQNIDIDNSGNAFIPPTLEEIRLYAKANGHEDFAEEFFHFYESKDWHVGPNKMSKWRNAYGGWASREKKKGRKGKAASIYDLVR